MYSKSAKGGEKGDPNRNPWLAKMPCDMIDNASTDILPLVFGIDELKQQHKTILECFMDKKYLWQYLLPTGFRKSLPFGKSTTNKNNQ